MVVFSMIATDFNLSLNQVHLFLQNEDGTFYLTKFLLQSRGQVPPLTGLVIFREKLQAVKGKNYGPEVTHPSMITELNVVNSSVNRLTNKVLVAD